ncbi:MAG: hypothetical protein LUE88_07075 [Clostridiales bacterium]|nr:hypothetical protein [Clostridiales bacterium]
MKSLGDFIVLTAARAKVPDETFALALAIFYVLTLSEMNSSSDDSYPPKLS